MSDPFVLDNWMARFLIEHSSLLSERQLAPQPVEPGTSIPADRKSSSGTATPARPSIEFLMTQGGENNETTITSEESAQWHDLSRLLHDQEITGEALIDSALSWLLDDRYASNRVTPT